MLLLNDVELFLNASIEPYHLGTSTRNILPLISCRESVYKWLIELEDITSNVLYRSKLDSYV